MVGGRSSRGVAEKECISEILSPALGITSEVYVYVYVYVRRCCDSGLVDQETPYVGRCWCFEDPQGTSKSSSSVFGLPIQVETGLSGALHLGRLSSKTLSRSTICWYGDRRGQLGPRVRRPDPVIAHGKSFARYIRGTATSFKGSTAFDLNTLLFII